MKDLKKVIPSMLILLAGVILYDKVLKSRIPSV